MARKQNELDAAKQRHEQVQRKYDESTAEFEQRLDLARDKERQLITVRTVLVLVCSISFSFVLAVLLVSCASYSHLRSL